MLKINPIKTIAVAAAFTAVTSAAAQNRPQKPSAFLTEQFNNFDKSLKDEFVSQQKFGYLNAGEKVEKSSTRTDNSTNKDFDKAVNFYNDRMTSDERYAVTRKTYDNLETRLYNFEQELDKAFQNCEGYQDIVIVPRWHYRYYRQFNDNLINFDIEDIRTRTSKDMESLNKLKDNAVRVIEKANGITSRKEPEKTKYDVDELAKKHFGMSYEEFKEKYKDELEYCKHFTYADFKLMDEVQADVYGKAKSYAIEMLNTTIEEAHIVNWNIGEKKVDETIKASNDMYIVSGFEYDGITKKGLDGFESGITFKAFEDALFNKYEELKNNERTGFNTKKTKDNLKKTIKCAVDGDVLIFNPNGTIFDIKGNRIK